MTNHIVETILVDEKPPGLSLMQRIIRTAFNTVAFGIALLIFGSRLQARGRFKWNRPAHLLASGIADALDSLTFWSLVAGVVLMWWNPPLQKCRSMWVGLVVLAITLMYFAISPALSF